MKAQTSELNQRILLLLKLDSKNLHERLMERKKEYIELFSMKRTREHFKEVFFSRYEEASFDDLIQCSADTITALDQFYTEIERLRWYLHQTEDMPVTVEDEVERSLRRIDGYYQTLQLYLDAELGINQEEQKSVSTNEIVTPELSSVESTFFDEPSKNE